VERLPGDGEIDRVIVERGRFGLSLDAAETASGKERIARFPHFAVGFDTDNRESFIEEGAGEQTGAGSDVGDDRVFRESGFAREQFDDGAGIAGAKADVVAHTLAEAGGGVARDFDWHAELLN